MNYWLLAAGIAALATFGIHVFMGGPAIEGPMLASALDPALKSVWSVVWHMVSAVLLLSAIAFSWAAARPAVSLQIATFPLAASVSFIGFFYSMECSGISRSRSCPSGFYFWSYRCSPASA